VRGRPAKVCPECKRPARVHFLGFCQKRSDVAAVEGPSYPPETPPRGAASRGHLWAIVDAAAVFLSRATSGRIGSTAYTSAAERLEIELARLPEGSCPGRPPTAPAP
jgi:hypothetical protein